MFTFDETFWSTFALTVVNLLVLFIVLKLLLFKPTITFMKRHIRRYFLDFLSHPLANINQKRLKEEWQV